MSFRASSWALVTLLAALVGCGDDVAATDAGPDGAADGGGDGGLLVTPPDIPWLAEGVPPIMLAPCPEGWREVLGGAVVECDPYPEGGPEICDPGEAHFPGEPGCRPIGEACPAGDYATSLPSTGPVVYVKTGAAAGGDGSSAAPYAALSEVPWVSVSAPTIVALAKGTYSGTLPLKAGVTVVGACVAETILTGIDARVPSVVSVASAGDPAVVMNLAIRGASQRGAQVGRGRSLSLRGVLVDQVTGVGLLAEEAGTALSLTDVVIRATTGVDLTPFDAGLGLYAKDGARVDATRFMALGNRDVGVFSRRGATVTLVDAVVRDTQPREGDRQGGIGINVREGAQFDATRILVSGNREYGVFARSVGALVMMTDAIVRETEPSAVDGQFGRGIAVQNGAELTGTRLLVAHNHDHGLFVVEDGSRAVLTDIVIRDTVPAVRGFPEGRGVSVEVGGRLDATRLLISNSTTLSAFVGGVGSSATFTDAVIQHTAPAPVTELGGRAVSVQDGARFEASRLLVADSREAGFHASGEGTIANLADVVIRNTAARVSDGRHGRGLNVQNGARVDAVRLEVVNAVEVGATSLTGATMVLSDAAVSHVARADCTSSTCVDEPYGYGVGAYGATVSMTRFFVDDAEVCGLMVVAVPSDLVVASLDVEFGIVSMSAIGACIQADGYDIDRLTNNVRYVDNATNLDTTTLPVPSVIGAVEP